MDDMGKNKKTAVFDAALALISEQGLHATPMSQISDKAMLGMGTIYHYFPGKEALINALYLDIKVKIMTVQKSAYDPSNSVKKSFKKLVRATISYYIDNPSMLSFLEQCENSPIITEETKNEAMKLVSPLPELFHRAKEEDLLKKVPAGVLCALLSGAVLSLAKLCLSGALSQEAPAFDASIDAVWDMLRR